MSFQVGWDKRQLSRDGPPLEGLPLVGRRSHSLAGPTLLSADPQVFSAHRFKAARSLWREGSPENGLPYPYAGVPLFLLDEPRVGLWMDLNYTTTESCRFSSLFL